jgi:hypothetical protein
LSTREIRKRHRAAGISEQKLTLASSSAKWRIGELDLVGVMSFRTLKHDEIFGYQFFNDEGSTKCSWTTCCQKIGKLLAD